MGSGWKGPVITVVVRHFGNCGGRCGSGSSNGGVWHSGRDDVLVKCCDSSPNKD